MKNSETDQKKQAARASNANRIDLRNEIQEAFRSHPVPWFRWVFEHLSLPRGARILELGSGSGAFWQENQSRISRSWEIILSDRSAGMLRAARENLAPALLGGMLSLDGQSLPFPDESFDAILAIGVLDLIPDVPHAILEAARVLRPSGQLIATAGGQHHLKEMEAMIQPFLSQEKAAILGGVENRFGLENGVRLLSDSFENVTQNDYQDQLVFHNIQPILDYILSEDAIVESMTLQQLSRFLQYLKMYLAQEGLISVTIQKALFIGRKRCHL